MQPLAALVLESPTSITYFTTMSIRSLSDMRREEEKDPNKKTTSSYTGGERSGLAVENPYDGDDDSNSAAVPPNPLGSYAHVVRGRAPPGARRVTIYKNGFMLDGGNFRSLDDPENVRFLEELKAGYAPRELQEGGRQVHIELVNEHTEVYTPPPPPAYVLFSGEGQTSGNASASTSAAGGVVDVTRGEVAVQEDAPLTTLQFRFHDGQRRAQRFNESHTIADVRAFVSQVAPVNGEFRLLEGFPPKEITLDPSTTLKDAGLLNATIVQKL